MVQHRPQQELRVGRHAPPLVLDLRTPAGAPRRCGARPCGRPPRCQGQGSGSRGGRVRRHVLLPAPQGASLPASSSAPLQPRCGGGHGEARAACLPGLQGRPETGAAVGAARFLGGHSRCGREPLPRPRLAPCKPPQLPGRRRPRAAPRLLPVHDGHCPHRGAGSHDRRDPVRGAWAALELLQGRRDPARLTPGSRVLVPSQRGGEGPRVHSAGRGRRVPPAHRRDPLGRGGSAPAVIEAADQLGGRTHDLCALAQ
mmetsp:Transcript_1899/g.4493  ORF Transcript_1899/g.4493 Transcript_1899/m.4493 type:complete len:256 (-) Transcript_1899:446-1213(-)